MGERKSPKAAVREQQIYRIGISLSGRPFWMLSSPTMIPASIPTSLLIPLHFPVHIKLLLTNPYNSFISLSRLIRFCRASVVKNVKPTTRAKSFEAAYSFTLNLARSLMVSTFFCLPSCWNNKNIYRCLPEPAGGVGGR